MTQNPFDALGGGGLDMNALLAQAQQMQEQLAAAQERLAETVVEGSTGGVTVRLSGGGDLLGVVVAPGTVDGSDVESLTDLGDLVVAAFRDAKGKVDKLAADAFSGGIPEGLSGLPGMPDAGKLGF